MKKWIFFAIIVIVALIFIFRGCKKPVDKCISGRQGCVKCTDASFFSGPDSKIYGDEFLKTDISKTFPNNVYPYVKNNIDELKKGNIYFDVSSGLAPATVAFSSLITSFKSCISSSNLNLWEVSYTKNDGKVSDVPRKLLGSLSDNFPYLKNSDNYVSRTSFLEGALSQIVKDTTSISMFVTDFLLDRGSFDERGRELVRNTGRACYTCAGGETWATDYFKDWFNKGGKLLVASTPFINKAYKFETKAYALFFIPKGHKYTELLTALKSKTNNTVQITIIDPSALSVDIDELDKYCKDPNKGKGIMSILSYSDRYVVLGVDNKKLSYSIKSGISDIELPLINETNLIDNPKLKIDSPIDFSGDIAQILEEKDVPTVLLGRNQKLKNENPISVLSNDKGISLKLSSVQNLGKNDILMKKSVVRLDDNTTINLNQSNLVAPVKGDDKIKVINNCLFSNISEALNEFNDSNYKKVPVFVIYSIINVKTQN